MDGRVFGGTPEGSQEVTKHSEFIFGNNRRKYHHLRLTISRITFLLRYLSLQQQPNYNFLL